MSLSAQPLQCHHVLRILAVATSIVTARHLFANGFHYPLLMLLVHVSFAFVIEGLGLRHGAAADAIADTTTTLRRPQTWTSRFCQALFAISIAVGLIFTYHSFLHNRNTTLCVMLLGLDGATVLGRTGKWLQGKQRSADALLSITTFLLCVVLVVWKENWLVGKGILFILVAAFCVATARYLWRSGFVENRISIGSINVDAYGAGLGVCLPLALFLLLVTGWYNRRDFHMEGRVSGVLVSTLAGALSLSSEARMKKLTSWLQEKVTFHTKLDLNFGSPFFPLLVLSIVEVDNCLAQHRPSTTSQAQWFAFAIAFFSTIDITSMARPASWAPEEGGSYVPIPNLKYQDDPTDPTKSPAAEDTEAMHPADSQHADEPSTLRYVFLAWHATLGILALFIVFYFAIAASYTDPGRRSWDLDIVVAWYDEPIDQVVSTVQLALDLPNIAGRKVRTVVYNKGNQNETELELVFPIQSGLVIRRLENVGREGETYLSHVLDSEQDWASHTMFIQAEPHEPGYLQARLEDYFVEKTGFLSLSHVRNFCPSCDTCNDHSGWTEEGTILRDIFERANPEQTCRDLSLTYRGQFLVSSRRMRNANDELLREVRARVVDDEHFGFTLERSWGTLFQCPTISERCPTLLSGWIGNRAAVEDCQCLD
ncbi:hypothetical protein F4808DRAFT_456974 [Astrocystis sublimbata]|nr:hypothetical protein F4808DRAFT_456974 [Astrocystis sublimbata]